MVVTFSNGQATGAMTGWGFVALGDQDKVTDPTCEKGTEITSKAACKTQTTWAKDNALCISGSVPALPASPTPADYTANWGVQLGVNATSDEPSGAVGQTFSTVTLTFDGTPTSGLRALLHILGDKDDLVYGFEGAKSGVAMDVTKFNTTPWEAAKGVYLTADATSKIDKVLLQVSSTSKDISVSNLCISKIEFGK
jgi:hypothetical protein